MEYKIRNGRFGGNINLYKVIPENFSLALSVFQLFTFKNSWRWKFRSRSMTTTFAFLPFDCEYINLHKSHKDICALALSIRKILLFHIFDRDNLRQGHVPGKLNLRHSIAHINLYKSRTWAFSLAFIVHSWMMSTNRIFCDVMVVFLQSGSFAGAAERCCILQPRPLHHPLRRTPTRPPLHHPLRRTPTRRPIRQPVRLTHQLVDHCTIW